MRELTLRSGGTIILRPLKRDEGSLLVSGVAQLSPRSIRQRFHSLGRDGLSKAEIKYLTDVDQKNHAAFVLDDGGRSVALGRYVRLQDHPDMASDTAEIALTILDPWQGRGLSKVLLAALMANARAVGINRLRAAVLSDNILAWRLLTSLGAEPQPVAGEDAYWAELSTDPNRLPATEAAEELRHYHALIMG